MRTRVTVLRKRFFASQWFHPSSTRCQSGGNASSKDSSVLKWQELAQQELRRSQKTLADLPTMTPEGIELQPVYYNVSNGNNDPGELPGIFPYTRGPYATMYTQKPWTIRQYAGFSTAEETNARFLEALKGGQQGLSVAFDLPTHRGYDSSLSNSRISGDVGMAGVAIDTLDDMKRLFQGIDLTQVSVSMTMNGAILPILAFYIQAALEQSSDNTTTKEAILSQLRGTVQNDILKEFLVRNTFIYPPEPSLNRIIADIFGYLANHMPQFNSISISGYHFQEAGADAALELAFTIGNGLEYLNTAVNVAKLDVNQVAPRLSFFWGVGMNYYMEIAKLRAARKLWATLVQDEFQPTNPKSLLLRAHCQTSGYSLTQAQPLNNVVRTTLEALAAVQGGTQSLHTNSYDEAVGLPTAATAQLARQTQLILQHESNVTAVADPWAGSYMMESLTDELYNKASSILQEVQEMGGMKAYIESGRAKLRIEQAATQKQARIDSEQDIICGVNRFIAEEEADETSESNPPDVLQIDNQAVCQAQVERLERVKASRDEGQAQQALKNLTASAALQENTTQGSTNLLHLSIQAAAARCSLGEISQALEQVWGRHVPSTQVVQGAYGASFTTTSSGRNSGGNTANDHKKEYEVVLTKVRDFEQQHGRRPRILVAKMGQDGHDRGAKVIASGFSDLGFDVDVGPLFSTPHEVLNQALDADVHVIGISSQAAGHKTLLPALKKELEQAKATHIVVVAGGVIPPQDYDFLLHEQACCSAIFGPGTRITDAAMNVLNLIPLPTKE